MSSVVARKIGFFTWFTGAVFFSIAAIARGATPSDAGDAPTLVPGWGESIGRAALAGVACLFIIEALRYVVPGWEREKGVKLSPDARLRILIGILVFGQLCSLVGWPNHVLVTTPYPDVFMAAVCAGLVISIASVVLNELLWKRMMNALMDKLDVLVPPRVKARRSSTELTPAPKLSALTTDQFRIDRAAEQAEDETTPSPGKRS